MQRRDTTQQTTRAGDRPVAVERSGVTAWVAAAVLALFIGVVYVPAINVPFIFDDMTCIVQNDSIVSLWPLVGSAKPGPLNPPPEYPTSGRPLVNLSFAVNYHFGELNPTGYHLFNLALHFLNAMLLWAITRRTLRLAVLWRPIRSIGRMAGACRCRSLEFASAAN